MKLFSVMPHALRVAMLAVAGFVLDLLYDLGGKVSQAIFNSQVRQGFVLFNTTSIPSGSPQANKQFSKALAAMAVRAPTPVILISWRNRARSAALPKPNSRCASSRIAWWVNSTTFSPTPRA